MLRTIAPRFLPDGRRVSWGLKTSWFFLYFPELTCPQQAGVRGY
ncbi:MAG: hypothetical protein QME52_08490 [Bacteroidota bacterium]|nr:hypothetical protein [Bacteroidota bacterium]